ncbi:MAG TPA: glycine cleavage system aminomethyltransferase GcvT [Dehalococcoidia bacterium]|nr:glycine cleavage system aminomethyltransferase GcvT [Dehalococcoidia bacterium]
MSETANTGPLLRTALHTEHIRLGARMVPFAGYEMPVQYTGVIEEHTAVRERAGMFDVSHMGRYIIIGPDAGRFLAHICTWDMTRLAAGEGHYAAACREDGGMLDDVYVFAVPAASPVWLQPDPPEGDVSTPGPQGGASPGPTRYLIVVNAANSPKMKGWMEEHIVGFEAELIDSHASSVMIAVQGPAALDALDGVIGHDLARSLKPRRCGKTEWRGETLFASRTRYTGEDGLELVIDAGAGTALWRALLDAGVTPCGLGARDTLRLESALLLYGNDMDEETNPLEVGLDWVVTLDDGADFIGRDAITRIQAAGVRRMLVCVKAQGRGIMRAHCDIFRSGERVGTITSGGYSPTLGVSIGMGFVPPELSAEGSELTVDVRGKELPVLVVTRPFYKRTKKEPA